MFLNLPDRLFFEKEIKRKAIQQNEYTYGWEWYFYIEPEDPPRPLFDIRWTGNCISQTNFIIVSVSDQVRKNQTAKLRYTIWDNPPGEPPGSNPNASCIFSNEHEMELFFEEYYDVVHVFHPEPKHMLWKHINTGANSADLLWQDNADCIFEIIPAEGEYPNWSLGFAEWSGFLTIGPTVSNKAALVRFDIDRAFELTYQGSESWNLAVVYGYQIGQNPVMVSYGTSNNIKTISLTQSKREFEIVVKPGESVWFGSSSSSGGFGITYIMFYKERIIDIIE